MNKKLLSMIMTCLVVSTKLCGMEQTETAQTLQDTTIIKLKGCEKDAQEQEVNYKYIQHSQTIKNLVEENQDNKPITLKKRFQQHLATVYNSCTQSNWR